MAKGAYSEKIEQVLQAFLRQQEKIAPEQVLLFSQVYYPVAILEIEMEEATFEDFDFVPMTVLRFVRAGVTEAEEIAALTGLSAGYVTKVLDLLMGYGFLEAAGITPLGRESLKQNRRITRTRVKQRFQADALTGDLLRLGEQAADANLREREYLKGDVPILPHLEGVTEESVREQLENTDLKRYQKYQGDILNANAEEIDSVTCVGLEYTEGYLVVLAGLTLPLLITRQYDPSFKDRKDRFRYQPVRLSEEASAAVLQVPAGIPCYGEKSMEVLRPFFARVLDYARGFSAGDLTKFLEETLSFNLSRITVLPAGGGAGQTHIQVESRSFTQWNDFLLGLLEGLDAERGYLYTHPDLRGRLLLFTTEDERLLTVSRIWKQALADFPGKGLRSFVRGELMTGESAKRKGFFIDQLRLRVQDYRDSADPEM